MVDLLMQLDSLAELATARLSTFLQEDEPDSKQIGAARIAASVLSAWTRHQQTAGAREATQFMMARELASNKDELKVYLSVAMPTNNLVRMLEAPKELEAAVA